MKKLEKALRRIAFSVLCVQALVLLSMDEAHGRHRRLRLADGAINSFYGTVRKQYDLGRKRGQQWA